MTVRTGGVCSIEDCPKPMFSRTWCGMHYGTWRTHGDPLHPVKRRFPAGAICLIKDCGERAKRQGMCDMHRRREINHGETTDPRERRFWAQVGRGADDECWPWLGRLQSNGYGCFGAKGTRLPHRLAYQYLVGSIPKGLVLDHLCHTRDPQCADGDACVHRRCCNPAHLEPVSRRENIARGRGGDSWGYVPEPAPESPKAEKPTTCTNDGCGRPVYKRTICRPCYKKWLKDPSVIRPRSLTPEQRFWAKVNKDGPMPPHRPDLGPCWLWTASVNRGTGYGQFGLHHGHMVQVHRYSYELANGPIPEGLDVHHECHVRRCCNPAHLRAVDRAENMSQRKDRRQPE